MGNNLNLVYKDKVIAALARKHNFCFYGENQLPDEDEITEALNSRRKHVITTVVAYTTWLASQEKGPSIIEKIDDIVNSVNEMLDLFEEDVMVAGRNWVLQDILEQYDNLEQKLEVLDDGELYRRREDQEKKEKYMENLRNNIVLDKQNS